MHLSGLMLLVTVPLVLGFESFQLDGSMVDSSHSSLQLRGPTVHRLVLDPSGRMNMTWTIKGNDIEIELLAVCKGWLGISLSVKNPQVIDIIMGGYDDRRSTPYIQDRHVLMSAPVNGGDFDKHKDVTILGSSYKSLTTSLRFTRKLNTGDKEDVAIVAGPMTVGWTYADSDDTTVAHKKENKGVTSITFIN